MNDFDAYRGTTPVEVNDTWNGNVESAREYLARHLIGVFNSDERALEWNQVLKNPETSKAFKFLFEHYFPTKESVCTAENWKKLVETLNKDLKENEDAESYFMDSFVDKINTLIRAKELDESVEEKNIPETTKDFIAEIESGRQFSKDESEMISADLFKIVSNQAPKSFVKFLNKENIVSDYLKDYLRELLWDEDKELLRPILSVVQTVGLENIPRSYQDPLYQKFPKEIEKLVDPKNLGKFEVILTYLIEKENWIPVIAKYFKIHGMKEFSSNFFECLCCENPVLFIQYFSLLDGNEIVKNVGDLAQSYIFSAIHQVPEDGRSEYVNSLFKHFQREDILDESWGYLEDLNFAKKNNQGQWEFINID